MRVGSKPMPAAPMTRVAFWYDRPQEYSGGLNYIRNLLYAIDAAGDPDIEPCVFFGHSVDAELVERFRPLAKVLRSAILDRRSVPWFIHKVLFKVFGSLWIMMNLNHMTMPMDQMMKMQR